MCKLSLKLISLFMIFTSFVDLFVGELMMAGLSPTLLKRLLPRLCNATPSGSLTQINNVTVFSISL